MTTPSSAVPHVAGEAGEAGEVERVGAREGKFGDPHFAFPIHPQKLSFYTNLKSYNLIIVTNHLQCGRGGPLSGAPLPTWLGRWQVGQEKVRSENPILPLSSSAKTFLRHKSDIYSLSTKSYL